MRKLNYMDSVHRDGTIWNLTVMALLMAFPISLGFIFNTVPDWAALLAGLSVALVTRPQGAELAACILLPLAFALLMGQLGLVSNLRHPNLNWTSESQAVKNGVSILIIMLLGWGLMVLLGGLTFVLSLIVPLGWALLTVTALLLAGAALTCRWLSRRGAAIYESL